MVETDLEATFFVLDRDCAATFDTVVAEVFTHRVPEGGFSFERATDRGISVAAFAGDGCHECLMSDGPECKASSQSVCRCVGDRPATGTELMRAADELRLVELDLETTWCVRLQALQMGWSPEVCGCDTLQIGSATLDAARMCVMNRMPLALGGPAAHPIDRASCPADASFSFCTVGPPWGR